MDRFYAKSIITTFFQSAILCALCTSAYAQADPIIRIKLSGAVYSDETIIRIKDVTTTNFDYDYDAFKTMSTNVTPSIYTYIGTDNYAINSIPVADSMSMVHLGMKILEDGMYTISFENSTGLHNYTLVDKKLGVEILVDSNSTYTFDATVADSSNRFELNYHAPNTNRKISLGYTPAAVYGMHVTSCTGGIFVRLTNVIESEYQIEIIRVGGRIIKTFIKQISNSISYDEYVALPDLNQGNYLVKLTCGDKTAAFHVVVM